MSSCSSARPWTPAASRRIDAAADTARSTSSSVPLAGRIALDRDQVPERFEIGSPRGSRAARPPRASRAGVDQPGDGLDLPRRAAAIERRQAELLDQDDAVAVGVVEQHRDRLAAAHDVEDPLAAPPAGEQAMAETHDIDPQMPGRSRLGLDDFEIGVRRRRGGGWRTCRLRLMATSSAPGGQARIGMSSTVSTAALSISTTHRSGSRPRWRAI